MKSRTQGTETNWTLDGETITVFIPMTWKRRGGQKVIIEPDGSDAWAPAKARPDETLIRSLARAHRWNRMLEAGKFRSIAEIAEVEKIDRSFVSRLLNITLLAPGDSRGAAGEGCAVGGADAGDAGGVGGAAGAPRHWLLRGRLIVAPVLLI